MYQALSTDGYLWFPNLCVPDPLCILPVFGAVLAVYNITQAFNLKEKEGQMNPIALQYKKIF